MFNKLRFKVQALVLAVLLLSVSVVACSPAQELKRASKGLTEYTINAEYNPAEQTVTAHQKVDYVNNYAVPLKGAAFHLYPNAFRQGSKYYPVPSRSAQAAYPNGVSYGRIEVSNLMVDGVASAVQVGGEDMNILEVDFRAALYPTAKYRIEFDFKLYLPNLNHRFGYTNHTVNLGNWFPIAAVWEDGSFDTSPYYSNGDPFFSQASNFNVNFTAPSKYVVASTGSASFEQQGDKTLHKLSALAVRDFALVLSSEFKVISQKEGSTMVSYYYYNDESAQNSLTAALDSIHTYNKLFGAYPYATYAVVQTPFLHGGMEYPALVMIADRYSGDFYREVIIHETAHQYWYAVVGNNQIKDAWMDEGLAEYSTSMFFENNPQYNISLEERVSEAMRNYILFVDVLKSLTGEMDTSMNRPSNKYDEYEYVCMIYEKGHLMFDSLRKLIGDAAFINGLQRYYADNKFKIATRDQMVGAFESAAKKQLGAYFDSWLEGKVQIFDF